MKGLTGLISKLFFLLLLIPSIGFSLTLDNHSSELSAFEMQNILATQKWESLDNQKLDCRKQLQSQKWDPAINACIAAEEMKKGQWQQASKYWQVAVSRYQKNDSIKAGYYLGLLLSELKSKKIKNAQKAANKALAFAPYSISLRYWLARSYEIANDKKNAAIEYEKIITIVPPRKAWLEQYYHANAIIKVGEKKRYVYAKNELITFLKHNADYYNGITLLAYIEWLLGDTASAIKNLKKADSLIPFQPFVQRLFTQVYFTTSDFKRAIQSGKQLLKIKPKDVTGNYLVGAAYLKTGQVDKGIFYMNRVSIVSPEIKEAKILLVVSYLASGKIARAKSIINELLKTDTTSLDVEVSLLDVLIQLGRYEDVVTRSRLILKKNKKDSRFTYLLAIALSKSGDFSEAEKYLQVIIQSDPRFRSAYIGLARTYMMQTKFSDAEPLLKKYLKKWPLSSDAYLLQGDLMVFTGKPSLALYAYKKATKVNPNSRVAWVKLLQYQIERGLFEEAKPLASKLIEIHPDFADGYFFNAVIAYINKDNVKAASFFKKTLTLNPNHYKALNHLGLLAIKNSKAAEKYFNQSIVIKPKQAVIYSQLAGLYLTSGDKKSFSKIIAKWKNYYPKSSLPYEYLAKVYRKTGSFMQAVEPLNKAIKLSPQKASNYLTLGDTYKRLHDNKQRILIYKKALKRFPKAAVFLNNLAGGYASDKQYSNALKAALSAEKISPNSWVIKDTVAWVYFLKADYVTAIKKYKKALAIKENSLLSFHLGKAYYKSGDTENAKKYFELAKKINSNISLTEKKELEKLSAELNSV